MSRETRDCETLADGAEDRVARLVSLAGPRTVASDEVVREVKGAVHAHWRQSVAFRAHRRRFRRRLAAAGGLLAAAAVAALVVGPRLLTDRAPLPPIGEAEIVSGAVWKLLAAGEGGRRRVAAGDAIEARSELTTADGGALALRLASGASVRLDGGTRVRFGDGALHLERGAVYVDSGGVAASELEVRTALGTAREIGTQFEVRLVGNAMRVRIRAGRVALDAGGGEHLGGAGDEMLWRPEAGLARGKVPLHGAPWDWTMALAAPFDLEGAKVEDFLRWVARETGWRIRWADPALERQHAGETLFGSRGLEGVGPAEAPDLVLPSAGLQSRLDGGTLVVEEAR